MEFFDFIDQWTEYKRVVKRAGRTTRNLYKKDNWHAVTGSGKRARRERYRDPLVYYNAVFTNPKILESQEFSL